MKQGPLGSRLLDGLASLRLAVVVILTLAGTCAFATFYEMEHGTAAVQREIYRTPGFTLLLGLLGVNIFSVMISRWPWKKHHIGFVLAHIGILILLAGSLVSLHTGLDSNMALFEGESTDRVTLLDKALFVSLPGPAGHGARFPVEFEGRPPRTDAEQRFPMPGSGVTLVAEGYAPHVEVSETFEAGAEGLPALHLNLQAPFATQDAWLLADDPSRSQLDLGPVSLDFRRASSETEARQLLRAGEGKSHLSFVLVPPGRLLYRASGPAGPGAVEVGKPLATPSLGMAVTVERFLAAAVARRSVAPAPSPAKEERRMPAVRVRLEGAGERTAPEWVLWTERRTIPFAGGRASVAYRAPELEVPFRVTLVKFNSDKYPGSNMPATYESWVRVDDPERGTSEHHISMNNPLHYRGYIFFQASFVEGTPMMSIFSVARAPGLPLVYLGVALIASGVAWMFYLKPYLARRQAARAKEAHQRRESRNEAPAADPVAGRSGPAQPARSGA
ncbi:MAG TPA: cytochrome c biogenesis protein ResB [Vicinamibacteria bacterium]|nr:cytochrome c biogenesis protein ResB [Vicinamibacteria bacterium]